MKSHFLIVHSELKWMTNLHMHLVYAGGLLVLLLTFIHPALSQNRAAASIPSAFFLKNSANEPTYALLVEKKTQQLYLFRYGRDVSLVKTYFCSTGQQEGNKKEQGDYKTPEGIYFFNEIKYGDNLPERYGAMAFVMDYPNMFDRIERKNGYGIWLHATNEPNRALLPNVTQGCIVVQNDDIMELSQYIKLYETPIVVVNEIQNEDISELTGLTESIENFLFRWKKNWEGEDLDEYMSAYSKKFSSKSMNWNQWRRYKRSLNRTRRWIEIGIEDIKIIRYKSRAILVFNQLYNSDSHSDTGTKMLYVWQEDGDWKIVGETWKSTDELLALEENKKDSAHGRR